jgi:membrane protein
VWGSCPVSGLREPPAGSVRGAPAPAEWGVLAPRRVDAARAGLSAEDLTRRFRTHVTRAALRPRLRAAIERLPWGGPRRRRLAASGARLLRGTILRAARDDITGVASQFAYNAFLATVPFLFVVVSMAGLLVDPLALERILLERQIPAELRQTLLTSLESAAANTKQAALFLALGFVGAIYVMSNVLGALIGGLDRVRGVANRPFLRGKLVAAAFAFATSLIVLATSLALIGGPGFVRGVVEAVVGTEAPEIAFGAIAAIGTAALLGFTLLLFWFGPNADRRPVLVELPGAAVAVGLWLAGMRLFALYLDNFDAYDQIYGSLGVVVIYLVFLYLSGVVLLLGAEINEQLLAMRARRDAGSVAAA